MGRRRRRLVVRLGPAGRCGFASHHAARGRAGSHWIDTAAVYGLGHSEKLVGRLVAGWPVWAFLLSTVVVGGVELIGGIGIAAIPMAFSMLVAIATVHKGAFDTRAGGMEFPLEG